MVGFQKEIFLNVNTSSRQILNRPLNDNYKNEDFIQEVNLTLQQQHHKQQQMVGFQNQNFLHLNTRKYI